MRSPTGKPAQLAASLSVARQLVVKFLPMDDKIHTNVSERALLQVPDREAEQYLTLQEAKVAWTNLPDDLKARATIEAPRAGFQCR
jgi:hypothetical protein